MAKVDETWHVIADKNGISTGKMYASSATAKTIITKWNKRNYGRYVSLAPW